jgi:3-deoxy-D-manno-octulosonate 8-phosphate phosphatase (KDO 8-P phosphatase)
MNVTQQEWAAVKLFITDVDGVLTDGAVYYGPEGELAKRFFIRDGMGLRLLEAAGVHVAVVTSEDTPVVASRVKRLMLSAYKPGMKRKGEAVAELMQQFKASSEQTVFVGDDVNDAEAMEVVGIPCAPADATAFAAARARHVTSARGGHGAIRELADLILQAKGVDLDQLWRGIHPKSESHDAGTV